MKQLGMDFVEVAIVEIWGKKIGYWLKKCRCNGYKVLNPDIIKVFH